MKEYHPSEIAILFEKLSQDDKERIINILPTVVASDVIAEMDEETRPGELLINLDPEKMPAAWQGGRRWRAKGWSSPAI